MTSYDTLAPSARPVNPAFSTRRDMNEDIIAAVIGLNEAVALLLVEPLHSTNRHVSLPQNIETRLQPQAVTNARQSAGGSILRDWQRQIENPPERACLP